MFVTMLCLAVSVTAEDLSVVKEVGPVKVTTSLTPSQPVIGDQIQFQIRVEAQANVEVLMPEFGEALDRYTILDFVPSRNIKDDGSSVFTQRYTLQPYSSGEQSIPPILVEFVDNRQGRTPAPEDLDAYEILTDRLDFHVKSVLPTDTTQELKPPLGELELATAANSSTRFWWIGGLALLGVVTAASILVWRNWHRRMSRRNAYDIARQRLDQLLQQPLPREEREIERFFVAISGIVRRYLEDRFDLCAPELTTEEFLELASSAGNLSYDHQTLLRDFLRQADLVKFAGLTASADDIRRSTDSASRFLEETRENAPIVAEEVTPTVGQKSPRLARLEENARV